MNSERRALLPGSSKIQSRVMSCRATRVVSSMSSPAWLAKVKTGMAWGEDGHAGLPWNGARSPSVSKNEMRPVPKRTFREQHKIASSWCHSILSNDSPISPPEPRRSTPVRKLCNSAARILRGATAAIMGFFRAEKQVMI